ncbi:procollagen-lysine,2-oxoglutarate 5-dioxygenase 2 [Phthorimaea operculella]|nr:procollagen-lysine,2-oxoglutarate 5-dioxygenase 2 [Phthorimaea operculella]
MRPIILVSVCLHALLYVVEGADNVKVLTVATDDNHGLQRYLRSAKTYGISVEVLGLGEKWEGGDMNYQGGGQKINMLKEKLNELMKDEANKNLIILFTDSYDVMFLGDMKSILSKFRSFENTRVLFSAEQFCWPDAQLASQYPKSDVPNRFLNSGGFIGYLPELAEIVNYKVIGDKHDDQLYYTKIYLDKNLRETLKISLDHYSSIFQNLNGAMSDVQLTANATQDWPFIENTVTKQIPLIVHGNGPSKLTLNHFGNYLAKSWSAEAGCALCKEKIIELNEEHLPTVMMAVFIEQATPFLEEFLQQLEDTDYPKSKIHLLIRNNVEYHETEVDEFFQAHSKYYATAKRIKPSDFISEPEARNIAKDRCINSDCDYLFSIDSIARIEKGTLRHLLSSGYDVVAPMLVRPGQAWSNFWGALNSAGFYARSTDYMDIVYQVIRGIWNVPFITNCYLINIKVLRTAAGNAVTFTKDDTDADMAFCASMRNAGIFMHVSNELDFGHLVNPETYDISRTHPDVYQVLDNKIEWENRYLHDQYALSFKEGYKPLMPCPDVYWFPLMSKRFCVEWIEIMEAFGQWSDGSNEDKRLQGGYEAVPTRDIHMNQVGLERQWLHILKEYVRPLQEMVFIGYYHNPPVSLMNFVVRYRPDEQPSLRPHHDSATYTINLALNTPHVDYEGGGCHFLRYNCSVRDTRQGWLLMHPGRLTHYHEGLRVTNGTRYIMISFVDP